MYKARAVLFRKPRCLRVLLVVALPLAILGLALGSATALAGPLFGAKTDFATGVSPRSVVIGDVSGDGRPDLAVANFGSSTVSVLLGDGAGSFAVKTDFTTGLNPMSVAIGDVNGDGKPDLAVANYTNSTVSVLLGNGAGGFGARTDFATGFGPYSVAIGDVSGDGKPDLAVANGNANTVSVLLGDGAGGFGARTDFAAGAGPRSVAIGDVSGDSKPDLAVANASANTVSVLLGDGAGGFGARTDFATGITPWSAATGDVNGDSKPDLVTANADSKSVSVLLGDGAGGFGAKTDFAVGLYPFSVAIGDLDGDSKPDLAVANGQANTVSVLLGDGAGGFGAKTDFATGLYPISVAIGDVNGNGKPDLATANYSANTVSVLLNTDTNVTPQPPATCITPTHPCVAVPVTISRITAENVRGFTVTVQLSSELALCGAGIAEGTYLSAVGGTIYEVADNGGGSYTVDGAILGLPCGATAASGTLFTVNVGSAVASGIGTVTVVDVALRDCNNDPVTAFAGTPALVTIDNSVPAGITALAASQVRSGNDTDGTTKVTVTWPAVEAGTTVHVYRAGFGFYPEYDDLGGVMPAYPSAAWVLAGDVTSGTTLVDEPTTRDFWYYVATVEDACGNVSAVSNMTAGTLNYHLGDVMPDTVTYAGDNAVGISDISLLGGHYGVAEGNALYRACLDVGATTTHHVDGRPLTDNKINFEDMMMFAINYGTASASLTTLPVAAVASDAVWVEGPAKVTAGQTFTASLRMSGSGALLGLSAKLGWERAIAEPVSVEAGELVTSQGGLVLSGGGGTVDCALLGADRRLVGEGELARVTFRALASGAPQVVVGAVDARDAANRTVELTGTPPTVVPAVTSFAPAMPNPFRGTTTLSYALAKGGAVELAVYGVDGRKVATLASGVQEAGSYRLTWDGGNARPGLYYARLTTPQGKFTRTLVLVK